MKVAGIAAAVVLVGMLGSGSALAEYKGDGNELLNSCNMALRSMGGEVVDNYFAVGTCLGFTQGIRQVLIYQQEQLSPAARVCFPKGMTNGQGVRIVLKYLEDNPAELQRPGSSLVYEAYKAAYPCN
jgi:hypothetical protein